jgi:hypothetical protein
MHCSHHQALTLKDLVAARTSAPLDVEGVNRRHDEVTRAVVEGMAADMDLNLRPTLRLVDPKKPLDPE